MIEDYSFLGASDREPQTSTWETEPNTDPGSANIVFFTTDLSKNALGRTYCLWQLATSLGWSSVVVSLQGETIWEPLRNTAFANACLRMTRDEMQHALALFDADLYIAVKPLEASFGVAMEMSALFGIPILLDVDDPDLDAHLSWARPIRRMAKQILKPKELKVAKQLRSAARRYPTIVSSPTLQSRYSGVVIPHIREDMEAGRPHVTRNATVAFVGSNRAHKGINLLRQAVSQVQDLHFKLIVTDTPPIDAKPWEEWVGMTSLEQGLEIVSAADIVVIPSLNLPYANGQLPVKLIDAMLLGRAIAISKVEPMPWALGGHGVVFKPGSARAIEAALRELANPELRSVLGNSARERARNMFLVSTNISRFEFAVRSAIKNSTGTS